MKEILEWLKPGARVKRYIVLQIISVAVLIFCSVSLFNTLDLNRVTLIAYIILITLSIFCMIFSFIFAQKNILYVSLKNISKKNRMYKVMFLLARYVLKTKNYCYFNEEIKESKVMKLNELIKRRY